MTRNVWSKAPNGCPATTHFLMVTQVISEHAEFESSIWTNILNIFQQMELYAQYRHTHIYIYIYLRYHLYPNIFAIIIYRLYIYI